ncbi:uncharacterized protein LOC135683782 [Rhopilema esculentum]|uniref:uncharacterized protein LOC135683782 n=1 Tax=Rhopilema esculentum TaxID=499914 RepID=UPI0031D6C82B|eukprot:gene15928-biopygen5311
MDDMLYLLHDEGDIDDEELLLLLDDHPKNLHVGLPYFKYERFNDFDMREDECEVEFRFKKDDIFRLAAALRLPEIFKRQNGVVVDEIEALCIALKRFAYPCRLADLIPRFGRPVSQLCMVVNLVIDHIFDRFGYLLANLDQPLLSRHNLKVYADAIHQKGAALDNCWGFVDGTVRPICRPNQDQRAVYNGHKRVHAIKFQSVVVPNGLIANLFGPVEGRRHDSGILAMSGLLNQLEQHSFTPDGQPLCIYGDPAYPQRVFLQCPFARRPNLTVQEQAFNQSMRRVRISVEWVFGDIVNYFKFTDFKKDLKIGLSAVGKTYVVCALLRNALTCLYGNNTSAFFNLQPPLLEEYFR